MSHVLQWEGRDEPEAEGPARGTGEGTVGVGEPDDGGEDHGGGTVEGDVSQPDPGGEGGEGGTREPYALAQVTDGRTEEGVERLALITEERYVELVGARHAFVAAEAAAARIANPDMKQAAKVLIECSRALCGALRTGGERGNDGD